ncbi:MAG: flagellar motor switch protein FliN [FCB group bacterium]|nr:flagellar motor switch protein FliN [FCB group bacterium]
MLQEEPEEKLLPEHTEGIQEAANQILGQLRTALDGMGLKIEVKNMTVSLSEPDEAESWTPPAEEGIRVSYTMATGEDTFIVDHYFWQTSAADQNTDIVPEPELDVDALFADDPLEGANGEEAEQTGDKAVKVHPADFSSLTDNPGTNGQPRNINMLLDVELDINVELGKKVMQVKDVLKLGKGTVVELDKAAGEPLDLFVSGRKFAEGEVVVVDDHFGIRITQLAGAKKRLESLGK